MSSVLGQRAPVVLNFAAFADLLEVSEVVETLDVGLAILHRVIHPTEGNLILVNTPGENSGCFYI